MEGVVVLVGLIAICAFVVVRISSKRKSIVIASPSIGFLDLSGGAFSTLLNEDKFLLSSHFEKASQLGIASPQCSVLFLYSRIGVAGQLDGSTQGLRELIRDSGVGIFQLVEQLVPELTKLNPNGAAHAKSVYSAVNMLRRCPPGPIFYALISNRKFRDVGGGFFALA